MIIGKPLPLISAFVDAVDETIREHSPGQGLSAIQRTWLAFCLTAILVTNSICWARFERASLGTYSLAALSWMFRHSKIPWDPLLVMSVRVILRHYGLFVFGGQFRRRPLRGPLKIEGVLGMVRGKLQICCTGYGD